MSKNENKPRIYIAGKITGLPLEIAKAQFAAAAADLTRLLPGWHVINPMALPHQHDGEYESYMRECIQMLKTCKAMYVMRGWHSSSGVMREINCASANRIQIVFMADGDITKLLKA